ncbi:D-beta-hydroxybutyrate dehydrogenase, mitochondrial, partial [Araneus ventricosus]
CDTGMGHRMARRFDELGMTVFAGCLQSEGKGALELKDVCSKQLHIVPLDVTNDEQVKKAVEYVEANLPPGEKGLHCLINNAGILAYADFDLMTLRMCEEVINVNLMGSIRVTKHFLPLICRTPGKCCL